MTDINDSLPRQGSSGNETAVAKIVAPVPPPIAQTWNGQFGAQEPVERGLLEYRQLLWRHKGLILACVVAGVAVGGIVTLFQEPTYVGKTSLEFQPRISTSPFRQQDSTEGYDESAIATYEHVLQSRALRERVVERLTNQPGAKPRTNQMGSPNLLLQTLDRLGIPLGAALPRASFKPALLQASRTLKAKAIPQTRIIEITCESAIPTVAADFANSLISEFMDEDLQSQWNSTQSTNKRLTDELQQLKAKMEESQRNLNAYTQDTGITFTSANATLVDDELRKTQQELADARNDRVGKEVIYKLATGSSADNFADAVGDTVLQNYRTQITDLNRQYAELSSTFTPAYYKVKQIQAQIVELQKAAEKERNTILSRVRDDYEAAANREQTYVAEYQKHVKAASGEAQRVLQYTTLKNDFDSNRSLYESVLQRVKELDVSSAMHTSNIRIIDPAQPPNIPERPNPTRNLALGLFTGILAGLSTVFWKDHVSSSFWGPSEGISVLNLPELGVIPSSAADPSRVHGHLRWPLHAPSTSLTIGGPLNGRVIGMELSNWQQQPLLIAESFRRTVASILFSTKDRRRPKVIVVTSPGQGDGKSTVSSNLSIALAEIRLRVLLIDCDLRHPRLHNVFDVANTWGVSDILGETTSVANLPRQALCRDTKIPNLQLLTSGPPPISVSELLFSERLGQLITKCRDQFDVVMIDTPPVLPVSDARAVCRHADGVVLVLRAGSSKIKAAVASTDVLRRDGAPILGTILNDWNPRMSGGTHLYDLYYASNYRDA